MRSLVLILLALSLTACRHPTAKQQPPIPIADLLPLIPADMRLESVTVPDADNGAILILKAGQLYGDSQVVTEVTPSGAGDFAIRDEATGDLRALDKVRPALDLLRQASAKKRWLLPKNDPVNPDFKYDVKLKSMVKALVFRGRARIYVGQQADGARDLLAARNAGIGMINGRGLMLDGLVGIACESIADRMIARECDYRKPKPAALKLLLTGIAPAPRIDRGMQDELRNEMLDGATYCAIGPDPVFDTREVAHLFRDADRFVTMAKQLPHPFDRRDTFAVEVRAFAIPVRNLAKPWAARQPLAPLINELVKGWPAGIMDSEHQASDAELSKARGDLDEKPNPVGRLFIATEFDVLDQIVESSFTARTRQEAIRAILAIRIWRDEHAGSFPRSLDALVNAGILKAEPMDLFSGHPLRYDAVRQLIWSVGSNGIDDGGMDKPWRGGKVKDLVWTATGA